jgi:hypothetical protein
MVYGGFAAQGALLGAAFMLYARDRWAPVFDRRHDPETGRTRGWQQPPGPLAAALAAAVAAFFIAGDPAYHWEGTR